MKVKDLKAKIKKYRESSGAKRSGYEKMEYDLVYYDSLKNMPGTYLFRIDQEKKVGFSLVDKEKFKTVIRKLEETAELNEIFKEKVLNRKKVYIPIFNETGDFEITYYRLNFPLIGIIKSEGESKKNLVLSFFESEFYSLVEFILNSELVGEDDDLLGIKLVSSDGRISVEGVVKSSTKLEKAFSKYSMDEMEKSLFLNSSILVMRMLNNSEVLYNKLITLLSGRDVEVNDTNTDDLLDEMVENEDDEIDSLLNDDLDEEEEI